VETPILAVIDLGTNTFKYVVGRVIDGKLDILDDGALSGRLGREIAKTGAIGAEAMSVAMGVLRDILDRIEVWKPTRTLCVGAMTLRTATDAERFILLLKEATGLPTRVLSGEEEALLAWKAATLGLPAQERRAVLDIGGGSFELITGDAVPGFSHSFALGAVTLTSRCLHHDPPLASELQAARELLKSQLAEHAAKAGSHQITVIGGSAVNLAAMQRHFKLNPASESVNQSGDSQGAFNSKTGSYVALNSNLTNLDGMAVTQAQLDDLIRVLCSQALPKRRQLTGLNPDRADIIIAGALILDETLRHLGLSSFRVSTRGIRHALLLEM